MAGLPVKGDTRGFDIFVVLPASNDAKSACTDFHSNMTTGVWVSCSLINKCLAAKMMNQHFSKIQYPKEAGGG